MPDLADIRAAQQRIAGQVLDTPFVESRTISSMVGAEVWLKFDNLQFTASFKERGALNRLSLLTEAERRQGVIAVSAGNHAQGVAYHAQRLGIPATIVMPRFTPGVKVENTRRFGAEIILHGETFEAARQHGQTLAEQRHLVMVHPYDDDAIIAGQGTLALEMLAARPDLDTLVIPVGGGGMIAGMATAAKALKPDIKVIGVQTERYPGMYAAFRGETRASGGSTLAEGIAVEVPGARNIEIVRRLVDDIVLVAESDIEHAIVVLLEIEKTVVEGAGAAGLAALLRAADEHDQRFAGQCIGVVLCGGNIDPLRLGDIIERGMIRAGRLARIRVDLRDLPGSLALATGLIAELGANVIEVHHQRAFTSLPVQSVEVDLVLQTRDHVHVAEIIARLNAAQCHAIIHDH